LWEELHHQGDVDEASYAAVPHLVRIAEGLASRSWQFYGLVSVIEIERHRKTNPVLPSRVEEDYYAAWKRITSMASHDLEANDDPSFVRSALGAIALAKKEQKLGALIILSDHSEIEQIVDEHFNWSDLYS
jgi:hypothetical protein